MKALRQALKKIDLFKVPVNIFLHQRDKNDKRKKTYDTHMGSVGGGMLTITALLFLLVYLLNLLQSLYTTDKDVY